MTVLKRRDTVSRRDLGTERQSWIWELYEETILPFIKVDKFLFVRSFQYFKDSKNASTLRLINDYLSNLFNVTNKIVICDELHFMSKNDKEETCDDQKSELKKLLDHMKESCMAWFVLSSSFLPDGTTAGSILPPYLDTVVKNSGYNMVNLTNIMRNSSSISSAAASDFEKYNVTQYKFTLSLSGGHCSTVIGIKPTCFLYRSDKDNYMMIADCVKHFLERKKSYQTVVLCDQSISPVTFSCLMLEWRSSMSTDRVTTVQISQDRGKDF